MMKIDILTLFPDMFKGPFDESIIKRAIDNDLIEINIHQLRDWAIDKHKMVDDRPYGGGVGMVLKIEPVFNALKDLRSKGSRVILMSPQGQVFNQKKAMELSELKHIILIAGRYEGYDERIRKHLIDEEISIGDYVLTGGELPAMIVAETTARLVPGVLEKEGATQIESYSDGNTIEFPQYTRPSNFNGWGVPEVLLSGNHSEIDEWRAEQSEIKTKNKSSRKNG